MEKEGRKIDRSPRTLVKNEKFIREPAWEETMLLGVIFMFECQSKAALHSLLFEGVGRWQGLFSHCHLSPASSAQRPGILRPGVSPGC